VSSTPAGLPSKAPGGARSAVLRINPVGQ
jgi:hypothetical protein